MSFIEATGGTTGSEVVLMCMTVVWVFGVDDGDVVDWSMI